MGVNIVAIIPNEKNRTQEELNEDFCHFYVEEECVPYWELFEWEGKSYASWCISPRYVEPERNHPRWEAIRRILVEVLEFLGAKEVHYGNDVVLLKRQEQTFPGWDFVLPLPLKKELLEPPDEDITPESIIW